MNPSDNSACLIGVSWKIHVELPGFNVPHLERAVAAAADQQPAVCGPRYLIHRSNMAPQRHQIPEDRQDTVQLHTTSYWTNMMVHRELINKERKCSGVLLPSSSIPDFDGFVERGRGEQSGVGGEEHFVDQSAVARHPGQRFLRICRIPHE